MILFLQYYFKILFLHSQYYSYDIILTILFLRLQYYFKILFLRLRYYSCAYDIILALTILFLRLQCDYYDYYSCDLYYYK